MIAFILLSDKLKFWIEIIITLIILYFLLQTGICQASINNSIKKTIVMLPIEIETNDSITPKKKILYKRINGLISKQFEGKFIVIDPFASEIKENEYQTYWKLADKKIELLRMEICRKYASDIALIIQIDQEERPIEDGYHEVENRLTVNGYDAASRELGINITETSKKVSENYYDALNGSHEILAKKVGEKLLLLLNKNSKIYENIITVRVQGNITAVGFEIFNKIINSVEGVDQSYLKNQTVSPNHNHMNSFSIWDVYINNKLINHADLARLIREGIEKLISYTEQDETNKKNIGYSDIEINSLKHILPAYINSSEITFTTTNTFNKKRHGSLNFLPFIINSESNSIQNILNKKGSYIIK